MDVSRRTVSICLLPAALLLAACGSRMDLSRSSTQVGVGVRAARQNLWREAAFRFQRAVALDPTDARAHNDLAVAYEGLGEFDKARAEYIEALRLDQSNQFVQKNYSRFVEFGMRNKKRQRVTPNGDAVPSTPTEPASADPPAVSNSDHPGTVE